MSCLLFSAIFIKDEYQQLTARCDVTMISQKRLKGWRTVADLVGEIKQPALSVKVYGVGRWRSEDKHNSDSIGRDHRHTHTLTHTLTYTHPDLPVEVTV